MRAKPLSLLPEQEKEIQVKSTTKPLVRKEQNAQVAEAKATGKKRGKLSLTLEDGMIVIRMPLFGAAVKSSSGKSMLYGSTRGPRRVMQSVDGVTDFALIDGKPLKAIASAFVAVETKKKKDA